MPTQTLFQTLELASGTWTIEVVASEATTRVFTPKVPAVEQIRARMPADPWADEPITYDSAGRALYSQTLIMKGVVR